VLWEYDEKQPHEKHAAQHVDQLPVCSVLETIAAVKQADRVCEGAWSFGHDGVLIPHQECREPNEDNEDPQSEQQRGHHSGLVMLIALVALDVRGSPEEVREAVLLRIEMARTAPVLKQCRKDTRGEKEHDEHGGLQPQLDPAW
jgi:hypothetical protein